MLGKAEEREAARLLRQDGCSVKQIAAELGVSQASVSVWVRDIQLTDEQLRALQARVTRAPRTRPQANPGPEVVAYRPPQFVPDETRPGFRYHHTKLKGDVAEAMALTLFAAHGFMVSRPFSENTPYDLIVDDGAGRLAKVQVKHARLEQEEGCVAFMTSSAGESGVKRYTEHDCDFFAAWCADLGMYVVPQASVATQRTVQLRAYAPRKAHKDVRWALD